MAGRERFYRLLAENFPDGIVFLFDEELRYEFVAGEGIEAIGLTRADLEGERAGVTLPPDRRETLLEHYRAAWEGEESTFEVESRGRHFRIQVRPVAGDDGAIAYGMGIAQDVTERRRIEAELRATARSLSELYEVTSDPEIPFDEKVETVIDVGREYLGLPYGFLTRIDDGTQSIVEARGDHPLLQAGESCPLEEAYCRRTIESPALVGVQDAVEEGWEGDPAYETFDLGCYIGAKVVPGGDLYGTFCFAATEPRGEPFSEAERTFVELAAQWMSYEIARERDEERLRRQNERLEEFASVVTHDLRNPLNVLDGSLELARETGDPEHFERAREAVDRMERIIGDVLALARQGEDVASLESVELSTVAREAWSTVDTDEGDLAVEGDRSLRADPGRLRQLLENLFRNAVEHGSERGGAGVRVTVGALDDGFYVADDGPGIPEDERGAVFEAGHTTSDDGTGFGLAIVGRIAEAHGWSVRAVESEAGGARFEFTGVDAD